VSLICTVFPTFENMFCAIGSLKKAKHFLYLFAICNNVEFDKNILVL